MLILQNNFSAMQLNNFPKTSYLLHPVCCPRSVASGSGDASPGGRGELSDQAGAGHCETAERGDQRAARAGPKQHQAAQTTAAACGKDSAQTAPPPGCAWAGCSEKERIYCTMAKTFREHPECSLSRIRHCQPVVVIRRCNLSSSATRLIASEKFISWENTLLSWAVGIH